MPKNDEEVNGVIVQMLMEAALARDKIYAKVNEILHVLRGASDEEENGRDLQSTKNSKTLDKDFNFGILYSMGKKVASATKQHDDDGGGGNGSCDVTGYTDVVPGSKFCYKFSKEPPTTWEAAKDHCKMYGNGTLASISTPEMQAM